MPDYSIFMLCRWEYEQHNARLKNLYVPIRDEQPNLFQRILTALRGSRQWIPGLRMANRSQQADAGAVAK